MALKNLILSILIVGSITGTAHYFSNQSKVTETVAKIVSTDKLKGSWSATYDNEVFKGIIHYRLKQKNGKPAFYTSKIIQQNGESFPDNSLTLEILSFDGKKGNGIYQFKTNDKLEKFECNFTLKTPEKLELSYEVDGYNVNENWTKLKK